MNGRIRPSRNYLPAFSCKYTMLTNRSALVPAPAGSSPPGTFASYASVLLLFKCVSAGDLTGLDDILCPTMPVP